MAKAEQRAENLESGKNFEQSHLTNHIPGIRESMRFVTGALCETLRSLLQNGRKIGHRKGLLVGLPAGGLRVMLQDVVGVLPVSVSEHRRKAPAWSKLRIPECTHAPDPLPPVCKTKQLISTNQRILL